MFSVLGYPCYYKLKGLIVTNTVVFVLDPCEGSICDSPSISQRCVVSMHFMIFASWCLEGHEPFRARGH